MLNIYYINDGLPHWIAAESDTEALDILANYNGRSFLEHSIMVLNRESMLCLNIKGKNNSKTVSEWIEKYGKGVISSES